MEQIMQPRILTYITTIAVFAALVAPFQLGAQTTQKKDQPPRYYVFNLGAPLGGAAGGVGINNLGWISGGANLTGDATGHAELWVGSPFDLGTIGGPNSTVAWPNHSTKGEIVGIAETAEMSPLAEKWSCSAFFPTITQQICLGFAWQDGVMSALPTLGGYNGYAAGVNNKGQVVGWAENTVHDPTCNTPQVLQFEAVIWGPKLGQETQLSPLAPDPDSAATAINDKGQVVGISGTCNNAVGKFSAKHALLWENGKPMDLGNFDGGGAWNTPTAINNKGEVAGFANLAPDPSGGLNPIAFFWSKETGMQQLPLLAGDSNSLAFDINERGQVVGESLGAGVRAFLYAEGNMLDLNALIQPNSSLSLIVAQGVNDRGEITGTAVDTGTGATVAFLVVPAYGGVSQGAASKVQTESTSRNVIVPENVRQQLSGFSRFVVGSK
jgi:probable HAF family extracellular repeat protein